MIATTETIHKLRDHFLDQSFPIYSIVGVVKVASRDHLNKVISYNLITKHGDQFELTNLDHKKNPEKLLNRKIKVSGRIFESIEGGTLYLDNYKIEKVFPANNGYAWFHEGLFH